MISPTKFAILARLAENRFWQYVDKTGGPDACWPWKGANDGRRGYGKFKLESYESARAHRIAYALTYGPIPDGLDVLHRCDNPPCCNPEHLFTGDHYANMADMKAKGRAIGLLPGERPRGAKLTDAQVAEIKACIDTGEGNTEIANRYCVGQSMISRIRRGKAWV